uniref:Sodium/potassium-transporting ATPase subunit beta-1-interacting protein n=1 Tax=Plectus sambesii TaxID=2011161 RepID=A0A914VN72_9BILA
MCSTIRSALITLLIISLVLTIGRQVLDFIGRLWLPIFVNFLHILFVIFGLFGAIQFRLCFVTTFIIWAPACMAYNAFIGCFYMQIGDIFDRNSLYLSVGLRQSYSFWLRHTFLCTSQYNLSTGLWMQDAPCYVPYYVIETGQAIVHGLVVLLAFFAAFCFLCKFNRKTVDSNMYSNSLTRRSKQPTITVEFSDPTARGQQSRVSALPNGGAKHASGYQSDNYDLSSGYMNSSFEDSPTMRQVQNGFVPSLDNNGRLVQGPPAGGYQRRISAKRRTKRQSSREGDIDSDIYTEGSRLGSVRDDYSAATTVELNSGRRRSRSNSRVDLGRPDQRTRSVSPIRRAPSTSRMETDGQSDHREFARLSERRPRSSSVKAKPFKQYVPDAVARMASPHRLAHPSRSIDALHVPPMRDDRRLSSTEVRGLRNSTDSALNGPAKHRGRKPPPNLTSLVSFDPKSNTLIRVQEHINQSRDFSVSHETLDSSQDSAPSIVAPAVVADHHRRLPEHRPPPPIYGHHHHHPPSADRISFDSGLPSSSNGGNSDWSSGASSRQPIGYEPALVGQASSIYEPVYRPSFYKPPQQQHTYQSHYNNSKGLLTSEVLRAYDSVDDYDQRTPATVPMINDQSLLV